MLTKYRITMLGLSLDTSVCPPPLVNAVFPNFDGWSVSLSSNEIIVEAPESQTPVDLGPLVKVEVVTE